MVLNLYEFAAHYFAKKVWWYKIWMLKKTKKLPFKILSMIIKDLAAHLKKFHGTPVEKH